MLFDFLYDALQIEIFREVCNPPRPESVRQLDNGDKLGLVR